MPNADTLWLEGMGYNVVPRYTAQLLADLFALMEPVEIE